MGNCGGLPSAQLAIERWFDQSPYGAPSTVHCQVGLLVVCYCSALERIGWFFGEHGIYPFDLCFCGVTH